MDTALRWQFPTPKHNANSYALHQQLQTHIPQRIKDLHLSSLIVNQLMIDQGLQLICNSIDVIRIMSIKWHIGPDLWSDGSNAEVNQTGRQMKSAWGSGDIGQ